MVFGTNLSRGLDIEDYFLKTYLLVGDRLVSSLAVSDYPSLIFNDHSWGELAFTNPSAPYSSPTDFIKHCIPCT